MDDKTIANSQGFFVTRLGYLEIECGRRGTSMSGRREETNKMKQREKKRENEVLGRVN